MKGVSQRISGSVIWWIRYADENGNERRKVGTKRNAEALYRKRKTTVLAGRKLPENLRKAKVTFEQIAKATISDCERTGRRDVRTFTSRERQRTGTGQLPGQEPAGAVAHGRSDRAEPHGLERVD